MARTTPSFFRRIGLAFSVLFNAERAARLQDVPEHDEQASAIAAAPAAAAARCTSARLLRGRGTCTAGGAPLMAESPSTSVTVREHPSSRSSLA